MKNYDIANIRILFKIYYSKLYLFSIIIQHLYIVYLIYNASDLVLLKGN